MAALTLSARLRGVEDSPTLALAAKAKALAASGKSIVNFAAGEPDFPTPDAIKAAGKRAIDRNQTRYTPVAGVPELREAIAERTNAQLGTSYTAKQILVSCGAKHALYNVFQALCGPGDEVVVLSPYWVSYPPLVRLAGATPVFVATREQDGFQPDLQAVRDALTDATRAIIVNSPSNPTGAVIDRPHLEGIAQLAHDRDLIVISDEIYDRMVFAPAEHISIVQVNPHMAEHTVVINGVSKSYSMTGWRIGHAVGPEPLIEAMTRIQSHSTSNPSSISQQAALDALTGNQGPVQQMCREFHARRDRMVAGLNRLRGCRVTSPGGAFYAWCNIRGLGRPAAEIAAQWLEEVSVATVPGEGFGSSEYIRFSFATSMEAIDDGLARLTTCLTRSMGA